ncbi:MAG TPA: RNA polymerase sigma factor [Kofleriaceae bacterium]|nr:RNA polymerase sigma factor [Kofleriaceae bacterium]
MVRSLARLGAAERDLEDLAQDVIVIALTKQHVFDDRRALYPWLWGIARNRLRDYRALARHRVERADDADAPADTAARDHLLAGALHDALAGLPEDQQLVIVLHDLEGWTMTECAAAAGATIDVAKYRLAVARRALKARLADRAITTRSA